MSNLESTLAWHKLLAGDVQIHLVGKPTSVAPHQCKLVFPGSFNPIHCGHRRMARIAETCLGCSVAYELSVLNVDKPSLSAADIASRLNHFDPIQDVLWLTRAPTFIEKSSVFPDATFIVGIDTLVRIADVRYYNGSSTARDGAISKIEEANCRFLVFGRIMDAQFQTFAESNLPRRLASLCMGIDEATFRMDVSSTELREHRKKLLSDS